MKFNINKISTNIWIYMSIFSVVILVFLWMFQVLFLQSYYELGVKNNLNKTATEIVSYDEENIIDYIDTLSYNNNVCIEIVSKNSIMNYTGITSKGCRTEGTLYDTYKSDFINQNISNTTYELTNPKFNNKTIVKAIKVKNSYIFISASLEILGNTVKILSNQLIIVTIIVLLLSVVVGYFISKKLSKPIIDITKKAEQLKNGNYDIEFGTVDSIYEIGKLEDTLNETAKELQATESIRREFLANVSHDIKTPLTMIKAYAEMIRDITYKDKAKREENLNVITSEVDRLNILVNDILELSKLQANANTLELEEFDLNELISNIISKYDIYTNDGYEFIVSGKKNIIIRADQKRIEQVLYNLINNAIVYTGKDKKIYIDLVIEKKDIILSVRDTGKGIKKEELTHIWDKYYKIDKQYRRNTVGSGIGLSIVKTICLNHNFEYGVTSKENEGSTFWIKIKR